MELGAALAVVLKPGRGGAGFGSDRRAARQKERKERDGVQITGICKVTIQTRGWHDETGDGTKIHQ